MADEEADKTIAEEEKSIPKINQLLKIMPPCCNINCQTLAKESEITESENTPQGNEEEPNHEMQGMLLYLNI